MSLGEKLHFWEKMLCDGSKLVFVGDSVLFLEENAVLFVKNEHFGEKMSSIWEKVGISGENIICLGNSWYCGRKCPLSGENVI